MKHTSKTSHPAITQHELRRVAVHAECDPTTVVRYLREQPVTSTSHVRIERALTACGYGRLVKTACDPAAPSRERRDSTPPSSSA